MNEEELKESLELHNKWINGEIGGVRLDLSFADLSYSDLSDIKTIEDIL